LRAGLFSVEDLHGVPLVGPIFQDVAARFPGLERPRLIHESIRRLMTHMVEDLLAETRRRLAEAAPKSAAEIRALGHPIVAFSAPMRENDRALKAFLFKRMYRHERVNRMTAKARRVVADLFGSYMDGIERMPDEWQAAARAMPASDLPRLIGDYIAGMTDRFAIDEHRAVFGASDLTSVSPSL
jgi:dGTPase